MIDLSTLFVLQIIFRFSVLLSLANPNNQGTYTNLKTQQELRRDMENDLFQYYRTINSLDWISMAHVGQPVYT